MADVSITAANVLASSGAARNTGTAGETITQGMPVYVKASDGKIYKAVKTSAAAAAAVGIALNSAALNQPVTYVTEDDDFTPGFTTAAGTSYFVGAAAGGISAAGDLATGNFATFLMIGISTTKAKLHIEASGVAIP